MRVKVFVPSNISCFFSVHYDKNPLKSGSTGVGILLDKGVVTKAKKTSKPANSCNYENFSKWNKQNNQNNQNKSFNPEVDIKINGKLNASNDLIAKTAANIFISKYNINSSFSIEQEIEVPIGSGFGTSGASALGVLISLNDLFNLNIESFELYKIAHQIEVESGTGLGDVISQISKGIVIKERPGILNKEFVSNIVYDDLFVVTKTIGEIDTSSIIQNPKYAEKISSLGLMALNKFLNDKSLFNLLKVSFDFANKMDLMNDKLFNIINEFNNSNSN
ncbi:MAG: hypothetical protein LBU40_03410, partial [Methanobrevibacter sp.]|nr:hypothetical protein [Methanobrevibacter sp.]